MERLGAVARLRPESVKQYVDLHAAVWPEVHAFLRAHHMTNQSIFLAGSTIFRYYEYVGDDLPADIRAIERSPVLARWNEVTASCQVQRGHGTGARILASDVIDLLPALTVGADTASAAAVASWPPWVWF